MYDLCNMCECVCIWATQCFTLGMLSGRWSERRYSKRDICIQFQNTKTHLPIKMIDSLCNNVQVYVFAVDFA